MKTVLIELFFTKNLVEFSAVNAIYVHTDNYIHLNSINIRLNAGYVVLSINSNIV